MLVFFILRHLFYLSVFQFMFTNWFYQKILIMIYRKSHPEVFLGKGFLKIYSKFTGEHPCRNAISTKLQRNFIEIKLRHECSPVNLLQLFLRKPLGGCFWISVLYVLLHTIYGVWWRRERISYHLWWNFNQVLLSTTKMECSRK